MRLPEARLMAVAALVLAAASLLGNLYLLRQLRSPERWIATIEQMLAGTEGTFRYDVRIPAGTPLQLDIPIDERFPIRIDTTIPIDTRARIPIRSPLGNYNVVAPIRADVPLRTTLPLHIQHTFELRTRTGSEIVVPIEIQLSELPWRELLQDRR